MQGYQNARGCHNVMRRFLPLVLCLQETQSDTIKHKLSNLSLGSKVIILGEQYILHMHYEESHIADISFKTHENLQIFK